MEELYGPRRRKQQRLQSFSRCVLNQWSARDDSAQEVCKHQSPGYESTCRVDASKEEMTPLTLTGWMAEKVCWRSGIEGKTQEIYQEK